MQGGEHSTRELTVSVKVPCQECGGRGYLETVEAGHVVRHPGENCLTCRGTGSIARDMPLSEFRRML
jgi:DnaJ-class molecular chaperone